MEYYTCHGHPLLYKAIDPGQFIYLTHLHAAMSLPPSPSANTRSRFQDPAPMEKGVSDDCGSLASTSETKPTISILNWNVNGIKTVFGPTPKPSSKAWQASSDGSNFITAGGPDLVPIPHFLSLHSTTLLCLQETKLSDLKLTTSAGGTCPPDLIHVPGYDSYFALSEEKKGYSGTAIFVPEGATVSAKTGKETLNDIEGRCVEVDLDEFVLINLYCPNGGRDLDYKFRFYERLVERVTQLVVEDKRELVMCGDFNIAHQACDIWNPDVRPPNLLISFVPSSNSSLDCSPVLQKNKTQLAFLPVNVRSSTLLLLRPLTRRYLPPPAPKQPHGLYFLGHANGQARDQPRMAHRLLLDHAWALPKVKRADILTSVQGSDHCPIVLELEGIELRTGLATCKEAANKRYPKPRSITSFFAPKGKAPRQMSRSRRSGIAVHWMMMQGTASWTKMQPQPCAGKHKAGSGIRERISGKRWLNILLQFPSIHPPNR
ncbi:Endonuclease/exonuclease/phosphatase [Catenaria anguillulae PL171]|uniref:Endonuclease/exonuclease/phosphatase n=1 Tax=Catenaria anguillulae PL171 TaxID=765915 RepID=A0A1Y2HGR9_9FUNG|nr:Endonuclease/exonuclease/phosphatase [Catenaria anguillulae PL171]